MTKKVEVEVIDPKDFERRCKRENFKRKVKESIHKTFVWIVDNKEFLVIAIPAIATVVKGTSKIVTKISNNIAIEQEKKIKASRIYDRSLGKYVELKRPLKNSDMKTILERRDDGEKLSNILMDMDLVKWIRLSKPFSFCEVITRFTIMESKDNDGEFC